MYHNFTNGKDPGPQGPTGMGDGGPAGTADHMSARNITAAPLSVTVDGLPVPLPDHQVLNRFTVNGANTTFTVPVTGTYLITYSVKTTADLLLSSRIMRNDTPLPGTMDVPAAASSELSAARITPLTAGDTLQLQLYGLTGTAILRAGAGASLSVTRLV